MKSYDGKRIEVAGLKLPSIELGKLSIEPKLVQAASQALLFLDASQYDLCMSIKALTDKKIKEEYIKKMIEDKFEAQKIYRALAALSLNVQGPEAQEAVKLLVLSLTNNEERTKQLEQSNLLSKIGIHQQPLKQSTQHTTESHATSSEDSSNVDGEINSIDLGNENFSEKMEKIRYDSPLFDGSVPDVSSHDHNQLRSKNEGSANVKKEMEDIRQVILGLNDEYINSKIEGQLDLQKYWRTLGSTIQELIRNKQYREIIGSVKADLLERSVIKITSKIREYKQADAIGDSQKSGVTSKEAELYIGEILRLLDDIYLSL